MPPFEHAKPKLDGLGDFAKTGDFASLSTRPRTPPSHILGSGGSLAWVLVRLGIFKDVPRATERLNWHADVVCSDERDGEWDVATLMSALAAASYTACELDIASGTVDLDAELQGGGSFFIDGVLNASYVSAAGEVVKQDPADQLPGPEVDESKWRHTIAVKGCQLLEQQVHACNLASLLLTSSPRLASPHLASPLCRGESSQSSACGCGPTGRSQCPTCAAVSHAQLVAALA